MNSTESGIVSCDVRESHDTSIEVREFDLYLWPGLEALLTAKPPQWPFREDVVLHAAIGDGRNL